MGCTSSAATMQIGKYLTEVASNPSTDPWIALDPEAVGVASAGGKGPHASQSTCGMLARIS